MVDADKIKEIIAERLDKSLIPKYYLKNGVENGAGSL